MRMSTIIVAIIIFMNAAGATQAKDFTIKVNNIEHQRGGNIMVMIFSAAGFPKDHSKAVTVKTLPALRNSMKFDFPVRLPEFAIKVLHDEDRSGKATKNWTGVFPAEGLGFSNGQKIGLTGPSVFSKSKLSRSRTKKAINIKINYP